MSAPTRVRLERPTARHRARFLAAVRRSRRLHAPWVSPPASAAAVRGVPAPAQPTASTPAISSVVRDSGDLVGVVNISEIVGGAFRSAYLGYYAFVPHAGRGLMREGLALVIADAFRRSVCTVSKPTSSRPIGRRSVSSAASASAAKDTRRAISRSRGRWRDHERWAILARPSSAQRPSAVIR